MEVEENVKVIGCKKKKNRARKEQRLKKEKELQEKIKNGEYKLLETDILDFELGKDDSVIVLPLIDPIPFD